MYKDKRLKSFIFFSSSGCLLPLLLIFNLFFGWIFLKPKPWLIIEAILFLLFMLNIYVIKRKIFSSSIKKYDDAIDVEGKVVGGIKNKKEEF